MGKSATNVGELLKKKKKKKFSVDESVDMNDRLHVKQMMKNTIYLVTIIHTLFLLRDDRP